MSLYNLRAAKKLTAIFQHDQRIQFQKSRTPFPVSARIKWARFQLMELAVNVSPFD